jgi:hypothetical protein
MFLANYDKLFKMGSLTVRYQNEYDIVPFLPYWPTLDLLAAMERRSRGANFAVDAATRANAVINDYVPVGTLRLIMTTCDVEYGAKAESDAWNAVKRALWDLEFKEIIAAHSADGRYLTCVCS